MEIRFLLVIQNELTEKFTNLSQAFSIFPLHIMVSEVGVFNWL